MVDKNDLFFLHIHEVTSGNHTDILSIRIQDREITVSLACHDLTDIVKIIFLREVDVILLCHKLTDRHGLVDQTGGRVCVILCRDDRAAALLCQLADREGHTCALADDNTARFHLDRE